MHLSLSLNELFCADFWYSAYFVFLSLRLTLSVSLPQAQIFPLSFFFFDLSFFGMFQAEPARCNIWFSLSLEHWNSTVACWQNTLVAVSELLIGNLQPLGRQWKWGSICPPWPLAISHTKIEKSRLKRHDFLATRSFSTVAFFLWLY